MINAVLFHLDDGKEVVFSNTGEITTFMEEESDQVSISLEDMEYIVKVANLGFEMDVLGCMCEQCRMEQEFENNDISDDTVVN